MERKLILAFLTMLAAVTLMIGLGVWQLERREWKLALIARLSARMNAKPVLLARAKELWQQNADAEYTRVRLSGRFLHDEERYLYTALGGEQGWYVITPLVTALGDIVLVNRGFVPDRLRNPATRKDSLSAGTVELQGLARGSERRNWFTPANDAVANRWFWRGIPGLIASLRAGEPARAAPFLIEAEPDPSTSGIWPKARIIRVNLPNSHLQYAITWFSLAAAFLVIFGLYARNRLREPPSAVRLHAV
jgi:surfeit locus 1 family protein